jgi:hypothetical protein
MTAPVGAPVGVAFGAALISLAAGEALLLRNGWDAGGGSGVGGESAVVPGAKYGLRGATGTRRARGSPASDGDHPSRRGGKRSECDFCAVALSGGSNGYSVHQLNTDGKEVTTAPPYVPFDPMLIDRMDASVRRIWRDVVLCIQLN